MPPLWTQPSVYGRCPSCRRKLDWFGSCKRRTCDAYAPLWSGDWKVVALANLERLVGVDYVTVTAPGVEYLPWDRSKCKHGPEVRCSGKHLGCVVQADALKRWERTAERRFAKLHRAAYARAARAHGSGPMVALRVWEDQVRGAPHVHIAAVARNPRERARNQAYVDAVNEIGWRYVFGHADLSERFQGEASGVRSAAYSGKYLTKAGGSEQLRYVRRPVFVGRFLTMKTGITMRLVRKRRWLYHVLGFRPSTELLPAWVEIFRPSPFLRSSINPNAP